MTVTALAPVPSDTGKVWVGTSGGAVLVGTNGRKLHVERTLTWESMPTGPVDALVATRGGVVFVAYNALSAERFLDPEIAERRTRTRVWQVSRDGVSTEILSVGAFATAEIRSLAFSEKHGLWAGTSAGLFVVAPKVESDAGAEEPEAGGFRPVTGQGRLTPAPIRKLAIAPDAFDTLWMSVDKHGDTPPFLVGFRPGTGWVYNLTQERGIPAGDEIDDLTFTEDGEMVVLVGSKLARGSVFGVSDTFSGSPGGTSAPGAALSPSSRGR
jgi:hypothetical protein